MNSSHTLVPRWLLLSLLVLAGLVLVFLLSRSSLIGNVGKNDFSGYWSATYLFRHGQNPYDPHSMETFQHVQMKTGLDAPVMAWNPPSLFVLLLPLSWLSFDTARSVLLLINLIIISAAVLMLARLYLPDGRAGFVLACLIFAFIFPPIPSGIYMGQVTFLVFLGLVSCMVLMKRGQWFWAGVVLILVTIKPHMVVLPVIYLLTYMAKQRQFRGWLGLFLAGILCIAVLFAFRLVWISDLIGLMSIAPAHAATPTIGGLLSRLRVTEAARSMIILFLPLPFILLKYESKIKMETAVALLTLITVPATFYGWSFDQTMLLIPVVQVLAWMRLSKQKRINAWLVIAISIALILNYYQRTLGANEVYYVWVPLFWWVMLGLTWYLLPPGTFAEARRATTQNDLK